MEIRKLDALYGWRWMKQGFQLIMCNPQMAITLALISFLAIIAALFIPVIGPLLAVMQMPLLLAGYMHICRALEEDEIIEITQLFSGFQKHAARLAALGGFALLGIMAVAMVMLFIGGDDLTRLLGNIKAANDPEALAGAMWAAGSSVALSLMVGIVLMFMMMLALQYAPMLIYFNDMPPLPALRASLAGSLKNIIPYTVYNLILQAVAAVLSILPFGIGLILLLPLAFTSLYVSYRNIFPFENEL